MGHRRRRRLSVRFAGLCSGGLCSGGLYAGGLCGLVLIVLAVSSGFAREPAATSNAVTVGSAAFAEVARVLRHPRCLNCHTLTEFPRVGDDRKRHRMNVQRGKKDHGVPGLRCAACHQDKNQDRVGVPGAPHWGLAPLSMGWEGLDDHELAASLLDRVKNGDRSPEDLLKHVSHDPLVLWGWDPGAGRTKPAISHEEFVAAFRQWVEAGAPLPPRGVTSY